MDAFEEFFTDTVMEGDYEELSDNIRVHMGDLKLSILHNWLRAAFDAAINVKSPDQNVRDYLYQMDNQLLARDGSAELTHEEAKQALRNAYLISCGKPREFHNI